MLTDQLWEVAATALAWASVGCKLTLVEVDLGVNPCLEHLGMATLPMQVQVCFVVRLQAPWQSYLVNHSNSLPCRPSGAALVLLE